MNWYTFTAGPRGIWRSEADAWAAMSRYNDKCHARHGCSAQTLHSGSIRLYECRTRALARTVDISNVRKGERIVAHV